MFIYAAATLVLLALFVVRGWNRFIRDDGADPRSLLPELCAATGAVLAGAFGLWLDSGANSPKWSLGAASIGILVGACLLGWQRRRGDVYGSILGGLYGVILVAFFATRTNVDIASSWFQAVLILPALAWGLGYLAYSMGELFGVSSGSAIESWLARRWL
ncbi:MAG: hypothetical protein VX210_12145, partial [Myxococcota bacterium]|nr:hypothetical protein [Myxococcota bacterium]